MERVRWETPSKVLRCDSPLTSSPGSHMTPRRQNGTRSKHTAYQNNAGHFTVLPSHITPPSGLTKIVGKNPFEADLTSRLHLSVISPTIFTKVSTPLQQSPEFAWSIDELANMKPAKIEEFPIHQMYSPDPEVELKAQAAIDKFFKENQIIPSPWETKKKEYKLSINMDTPSRPLDDLNSTKELSKKDAWSQTTLSLPINLPQTLEDVLKSYLTFTQEQNGDSDDINLSNNSLRRKLFFNNEEHNNGNESFVSSSSIEMNGSMVLPCSPPQSGMFVHYTLKESLQTRRQSDSFKSLSPPYMSPIHNNKNDMLYKRDFTANMSIDDIEMEKSKNFNNDDLLDTFSDENDMKSTDGNRRSIIVNHDKTNLYVSHGVEALPRRVNLIDSTMHSDSVVFNDRDHNAASLKFATEIGKNSTYESKQSNTMFGIFDPQNISNSVQDTGYQTYSMNSTMHTVDSYNGISINHKIHSSEQMLTFKDDAQLSWKEDMKNVFSSTPSKTITKKNKFLNNRNRFVE